ncbi:MAG: PAS domain S-box protein [bacterium]|nr:PAS domain S-box protein [bacterium]
MLKKLVGINWGQTLPLALRHLGMWMTGVLATGLMSGLVWFTSGGAPPTFGLVLFALSLLTLIAAAASWIQAGRDLKKEDEIAKFKLGAERFTHLAGMMTSGVFELDSKSRLVYVNEQAAEITGYARDDLATGFDGVNLFNYENEEHFRKSFSNLMSEGMSCNSEFTGMRANCGEYPLHLQMKPIRDGKRITGARGTFTDISDQKESEKLLMDSFAETVNLLESIPSILIGIDKKRMITKWNKAAERAFGMISWDVTDSPLNESGIKWEWNLINNMIDDAVRGDKILTHTGLPYIRINGNQGLMELTVTPLKDNLGNQAGAIILCVDITEKDQMEHALAEAHQLDAIGSLVQGIAREINIPTLIVGENIEHINRIFTDVGSLLATYTDLERNCGRGKTAQAALKAVRNHREELDFSLGGDEVKKAVEQSLAGMKQITDMVDCLIGFSREQEAGWSLVDLNLNIRNSVGLTRGEWKHVAELTCNLDPELKPIYCNPGEISNIFLNMITNAIRAIKSVAGGKLGDKGEIIIATSCHPDGIGIEIRDTGQGMDQDTLEQIFDPHFTTHEGIRRTGQNLSASKEIIEIKHRGRLLVESTPGTGTTFTILLPVGEKTPSPAEERSPAAAVVANREIDRETGKELPTF